MTETLITKQSDELEQAHDALDRYGILAHDNVAVRIGFLGDRASSLEDELSRMRKLIGAAS